jgi:hypothetical protein
MVAFFTSLMDWPINCMKALRVSFKVDDEEEVGARAGGWYSGAGWAGRP